VGPVRLRLTVPLLLLALVPAGAALTGPAAAASTATVVDTGHSLAATVTGPGEGLLDLTVSAPGADWSAASTQSAVLEVDVDGIKATDLVVPSDTPTPRRVQLGTVTAGEHAVVVRLSPSSPRDTATVTGLAATAGQDVALRYAPVVFGRTVAAYGGTTQNAVDDAPVIGWHEANPGATPGTTTYEYSVIWTNEDNGTGSPDLMARYGRTVDIEYAVRETVVDATGAVVSEVFQGPNHVDTVFQGRHEGSHPLLQTCTGNNNFCDDATTPEGATAPVPVGGPLRFLLGYDESRQPGRARESLVDRHPWVYPVMAAEQIREAKISQAVCLPQATDTVHICDQRRYLYLEVAKTTGEPLDPTGTLQPIGISLGVVLRDGRVLRGDRGIPGRAATRDVPVATTVELPAGVTADDVVRVLGFRVDTQPSFPDPGSTVTVTGLARGFTFDDGYLPRPSFVTSTRRVVLPQDGSGAVLWDRAVEGASPALPEFPAPAAAALVVLGLGLGLRSARRRDRGPRVTRGR